MIAKRTFPVRTAGALTAPLVRKLDRSSETDEQPLLEAARGPPTTRDTDTCERGAIPLGPRPTRGSVPRSPGGDAIPNLDEPIMKQQRQGETMKEEQPSRNGSQKQSKQSAARVPLFLQPLKPLPGESRSEFASRGLLEIKRGLIERLRAEEENRK